MVSRRWWCLSALGKVVYPTSAGELANARKMGDRGIYDLFDKVAKGGKWRSD